MSDCFEPDIVVTGTRLMSDWEIQAIIDGLNATFNAGGGFWPGGGDSELLAGGDGGGGTPSDGEPMPDADIAGIRALAQEIAELLKVAGVEFTVFVYRTPSGELRMTAAQTTLSSTSNAADITVVPPGSLVVAVIHNHPNNISLPSNSSHYTDANDWMAWQTWTTTDYSAWGITVDPNLLNYIVTINGVFEYTADDFDTSFEYDGFLLPGG
jgi:hypothetical protein